MGRQVWRIIRAVWSVTVELPLLWWAEWRYQTKLARWERAEHQRGLYPQMRLARLRAQREFAAMVDDLLRQAGMDTATGTEGECWSAKHMVLVPHFPDPADTKPETLAARRLGWSTPWWDAQPTPSEASQGA
jgi:hypothetical protein